MDKEYIIRLLHTFNPQWEGKKPDIPGFKRELYGEIKKDMDKKQIIAITGLRRTGKTTLMKQVLSELPNKSCMYFSFDEIDLQKKEVLRFVMDYFLNNFDAKYIFLDEIHYIPDWQGILKRYYDTENLKFVISGSASMQIKKSRESLAGRIMSFYLPTLSFREFLGLTGEPVKIKDLDKFYKQVLPRKEFFENQFKEYLFKGAFPEIIKEKNEEFIRKYITDIVVKKIIFEDIPEIYRIERKSTLYELYKYICKESSNLFEMKNLSGLFNLNIDTVSKYLLYLDLSYLTKKSEIYSKSIATRIRKLKKFYVVHPSIAFAMLDYSKNILDVEQVMGLYIESLFSDKFFWRTKEKEEIDVILEIKGKPLPVEIKYRNKITKKDFGGLLKFCDKFKCKKGLIITKDMYKQENIEGKEILFIPAWLFSLCLDKIDIDNLQCN